MKMHTHKKTKQKKNTHTPREAAKNAPRLHLHNSAHKTFKNNNTVKKREDSKPACRLRLGVANSQRKRAWVHGHTAGDKVRSQLQGSDWHTLMIGDKRQEAALCFVDCEFARPLHCHFFGKRTIPLDFRDTPF
jgi:hypothetical protein